jgi:predicted ferric reductase
MGKRNSFSGSLLYTIAVILLVIWSIAYFGYEARDLIHVLLVIAVVAVLFRVIRGRN